MPSSPTRRTNAPSCSSARSFTEFQPQQKREPSGSLFYALSNAVWLFVLRPQTQWLTFGGPQLQLLGGGEVPAFYLAQAVEKACFLLHQRRCAHLAGAAGGAEAELVTLQAVTGKPVVAAGVAIGAAVVTEGDGQVTAVDQWTFADPFHLVAVLGFQLLRGCGAAHKARSQQADSQYAFHIASLLMHFGHRCLAFFDCQPSSLIRTSAAGAWAFLPSAASTANSKSSCASQLSQLACQLKIASSLNAGPVATATHWPRGLIR